MSKHKLSGIENNLAVMVGLTSAQMAGLEAFDKQGKVKAFLESHKLDAKWVKK